MTEFDQMKQQKEAILAREREAAHLECEHEISRLRQELTAEKSRLDWLDENATDISWHRDLSKGLRVELQYDYPSGCVASIGTIKRLASIREAIDAAIQSLATEEKREA